MTFRVRQCDALRRTQNEAGVRSSAIPAFNVTVSMYALSNFRQIDDGCTRALSVIASPRADFEGLSYNKTLPACF